MACPTVIEPGLRGKNKDSTGELKSVIRMPLVTCISDWNQQDYYLGLLKGRLKTEVPELEIMDLNHSIAPFHAVQASFILRQVISHFPPGTIHLMLVNQGHNPEISPVVASYRSQYVI
ncbi:MAG: SAM-dependent chlorinase/fluorinase, partial [Bacteroidales bacterium]|nr:SAM-dependent chlorinase/fluorinase [Bacteroidales bacterium]